MTGSAQSASLRAVALPTEHGGWSFTLEPALLGLLASPSVAGLALAGSALVGFLARTPLRIVLIDRHRDRRLDRTSLARRVLALEALVLVAFLVVVVWNATGLWWQPIAVAAPLVAVELWYDARSRSRRLVPELAGTVGIASIAAAVALAGGLETATAHGLWLVMGARAVAAVFFVRLQLRRAKKQPHNTSVSDLAQLGAIGVTLIGLALDAVPLAGVAAVAALAAVHVALARTAPPRTGVLGAQQIVLGLTVVLVTGLAVAAP